MEELKNKHKTWIRQVLVENLIENQKLIICQQPKGHIVTRSIEIKEMSLEVAFMLTVCYFVKIAVETTEQHVECESGDGNKEKIFDIVVKVKVKPIYRLN